MAGIGSGLVRRGFVVLPSLISLLLIGACLSNNDCPIAKCSRHGPEIGFPFRLNNKGDHEQPKQCGYPGFELFCKDGQTVLDLPSSSSSSSSGLVLVQSISYSSRTLSIYNSNNCFAALFFNLNFRPVPRPYYYTYNYATYIMPTDYCGVNMHRNSSISIQDSTRFFPSADYFAFFDCSQQNDTEADHQVSIPCMSNPGHYYLLADSTTPLGLLRPSCSLVKTVCVPYQYRHGSAHGGVSTITLSWDLPDCHICQSSGKACGFVNETTGELGCLEKGALVKDAIIGAGSGFFLVLVLMSISIKVYQSRKRQRKKEMENQLAVEKFLEDYNSQKPTRYSYSDVKRMTQQFKCKLGKGANGTVFRGSLPNGTFVAVKILKSLGGDGVEFINEVCTMGRIHHVNVVRLLGFCSEGFKRALLYEFMPNESLEKFIFSKHSNAPPLGWLKLQDIAIGIARGIEYLHQGCEQRILHFDIKPHNILLDENFNPKISDFGLAKLCLKEQSIVSMTAARGTVGYIAPEVFSRNFGNVSYKSDVYSYGMLLLEMVGGRKATDSTVENSSQVFLPEWIYNRLEKGEDFGVEMALEGDPKIAKKLAMVAIWCIQWYPVDRPTMKTVVQMLEGNVESLIMPPNPFTSTSEPKVTICCIEKQYDTKLAVISEEE